MLLNEHYRIRLFFLYNILHQFGVQMLIHLNRVFDIRLKRYHLVKKLFILIVVRTILKKHFLKFSVVLRGDDEASLATISLMRVLNFITQQRHHPLNTPVLISIPVQVKPPEYHVSFVEAAVGPFHYGTVVGNETEFIKSQSIGFYGVTVILAEQF